MQLKRTRVLSSIALVLQIEAVPTFAAAAGVVVDYSVAAAGQTAKASYEFLDASTLQIALSETTPADASALTGGGAVLTQLGFLLPRVQIAGGSAVVGAGSGSAGFAGPELAGGDDVSTLWGFTGTTLPVALQAKSLELATDAAAQLSIAAEQGEIGLRHRDLAKAKRDAAAQLLANNPDAQMRQDAADLIRSAEADEAIAGAAGRAEANAQAEAAALQSEADDFSARSLTAPALQVVGVLADPLIAFLASAPGTGFDGIAGGLVMDELARGDAPVIVNSVLLTLMLTEGLSAEEREEFLADVITGSAVSYGNGGVFGGVPVPEPQTWMLLTVAIAMRAATRRRPSASRESR